MTTTETGQGNRSDLRTLLWLHSLMLDCAAHSTYQGEWAHYIARAQRCAHQITTHLTREEEDVGPDAV